jgi:excinuclease ABC subunit A
LCARAVGLALARFARRRFDRRSPARRVTTRTPRSTVGSMTELYDYLRLLFARVGITYSPVSGKEVKKQDVQDVIQTIQNGATGNKVLILVPFKQHPNRNTKEELNILLQKGFSRLYINQETVRIEDLLNPPDDSSKTKKQEPKLPKNDSFLLIDLGFAFISFS